MDSSQGGQPAFKKEDVLSEQIPKMCVRVVFNSQGMLCPHLAENNVGKKVANFVFEV